MADHRDQIDELLEQADELDHGTAQLALTEQAVNLADLHRDEDYGYKARLELISAGVFGGRTDLAMIAFSWVLAKHDADPARFDGDRLLWMYKWVLDGVADYPSIPKADIEKLFADMKVRYEADGSTLHAYWGIRRNIAIFCGELDAALEANEKLQDTARDHLSNCHACVQDESVDYYTYVGDDAAAIEAAKPIFKGKLTCGEVPERTYASVQLPLLRLGKAADAMGHYKTGYRKINFNPKFLRHKAMYLVSLTLTDNVDRAVKLLDRHLQECLDASSPLWQFEFLLAARLLCERLTQKGQTALPIRIPDKLTALAGQTVTVPTFAAWLDGELARLAKLFDDRNGNGYYAERAAGFRELFQYAKPCPVK
jgi:hypothetical protein